jgi:hypothetical protein
MHLATDHDWTTLYAAEAQQRERQQKSLARSPWVGKLSDLVAPQWVAPHFQKTHGRNATLLEREETLNEFEFQLVAQGTLGVYFQRNRRN